MVAADIGNLVFIVTFVTLVVIGYAGFRYNAKQRAKQIHDALHGEAPSFDKLNGESATTLVYLLKLERERVRLRLEKLTTEESAAVSLFHYFISQSLVIPWTEEENRRHWSHASRSRAFAAKALAWKKANTAPPAPPLSLPEPTPAQLVEELAMGLAPVRPQLDLVKNPVLRDLAAGKAGKWDAHEFGGNVVDPGPRDYEFDPPFTVKGKRK